jgi:cytochrome c peroxidase
MRKLILIPLILALMAGFLAFVPENTSDLRKIYSQPSSKWPTPFLDPGIEWTELGIMPAAPVLSDSLKKLAELGKTLFFDTRMSGSGKISCASCHQPELSWTDAKPRSIGHDGAMNKRNSPSIQNTWFYKRLFWDGRSNSLEDQAFAPINSESEMHNEMGTLTRSINRIPYYRSALTEIFGSPSATPERITSALAAFQRTVRSQYSKFDSFLLGNRNALNKSELRGLHLFRTRARCINCHNGPMFSDNSFHNNGLAKNDDGYYKVTHLDIDLGKMKTPSLRDIARTGPWMHDGSVVSLDSIIEHYNSPSKTINRDPLIQPLKLSAGEKRDLLAFLNAISSAPAPFTRPQMPREE